MKKSLLALLSISLLHGEDKATLLFEDDFERKESQEKTEEIGKSWGSNSNKRAKGNKQVDLKDGAMHIAIHPEADHAVSVTHEAKFKNGRIDLRFQLENKDDSLGLNFADLDYKKSSRRTPLRHSHWNLQSRHFRPQDGRHGFKSPPTSPVKQAVPNPRQNAHDQDEEV